MLLLLALAFASVSAQPPSPPVPSPARPAPYFSWAEVPRAFHGANKSGLFTDDALLLLSNYSMVTLEKWYTPCASQGPTQGNASCDVEDKMFGTFRQLKAMQPAHTIMLYLNSMFDFAFYRLNGLILAREAAGERLLLRDERGTLVSLCNDGDYYCNVTNFDLSVAAMRDLWLEAVDNATSSGGVDGVFMDHATSAISPSGAGGVWQLCNGRPAVCWNFSAAFATAFNAGHAWLVNVTQDRVARLPGKGAVIDGPYAAWPAAGCNFSALRPLVEAGLAGTGPFVLEAQTHESCSPDDSCLANFLAAAERYTYLSCFADAPAPPQPQFFYSLGPPTGPPVESGGVVRRSFLGPLGLTNASVDLHTGVGTMEWAAAPPAPPPAPPLPAICGALPPDTAVAQHDVAVHDNVADAGACCALCAADAACAIWCFHGELPDKECHLHSAAGQPHPLQGATSGIMNRTTAKHHLH